MFGFFKKNKKKNKDEQVKNDSTNKESKDTANTANKKDAAKSKSDNSSNAKKSQKIQPKITKQNTITQYSTNGTVISGTRDIDDDNHKYVKKQSNHTPNKDTNKNSNKKVPNNQNPVKTEAKKSEIQHNTSQVQQTEKPTKSVSQQPKIKQEKSENKTSPKKKHNNWFKRRKDKKNDNNQYSVSEQFNKSEKEELKSYSKEDQDSYKKLQEQEEHFEKELLNSEDKEQKNSTRPTQPKPRINNKQNIRRPSQNRSSQQKYARTNDKVQPEELKNKYQEELKRKKHNNNIQIERQTEKLNQRRRVENNKILDESKDKINQLNSQPQQNRTNTRNSDKPNQNTQPSTVNPQEHRVKTTENIQQTDQNGTTNSVNRNTTVTTDSGSRESPKVETITTQAVTNDTVQSTPRRKTQYKETKKKSATPLIILIIVIIIVASAFLINKQIETQNATNNAKTTSTRSKPNQIISSNSKLRSNKGDLNDYIDAWEKVTIAPKSKPNDGTNSASVIATFGDNYTSNSNESDITTIMWNKHNNKYKIKLKFTFYLDHAISKQLSGLYNSNPDLATKQNFEAIKTGMTENDVKQKVGSPSQINESFDDQKKKTEVDLYSEIKGENKNVSYSIVYQHGKVIKTNLGK